MHQSTAPRRRSAPRLCPIASAALLTGAVLVGTTGCVDTGAEAAAQADLLGFLRPRRADPARRFGESLRLTAPTAPGADIGEIAPFVERRSGPGRTSATHVLWPFFSASRSPDQRSFALRPLVAAESSPGRTHVEVLWPIGSYRREGEDRTLLVRPIFYYKRRVRGGGPAHEVDTDWSLFPIVFGGRDTKEGPYFAILPIGGVVKGQLGKRKISFFLWPLWTSTVDLRYRSFNIMWPFLACWRGPDQAGRRLWPFFGADRREGRFDRRFYLWPFFAKWRTGLDTRYPGEAAFFFPFFGRIRTSKKTESGELEPYREHTTVLWPLFSRMKLTYRNIDELHIPWPFIGLETADGLTVRKLWPLWGERKSNDRRDRFVMWPLFRRSIWHDEDKEHRWYNIGLVFTSRLERWAEKEGGGIQPPAWPDSFRRVRDPRLEAGTHRPWATAKAGSVLHSRRWVQLWPVFHYHRSRDRVRFQMLSVLPHRTSGEAETLLGPFFNLYSYERGADLQKRESFLFGLFRHFRRPDRDSSPGMRYVNLAGLVSYHRRTAIGKRFSILGGLIGYERVGNRRAYRFLWAPFGRIPSELREAHEGRSGAHQSQ